MATDGLRLKTVLLNAAISFGIGAAIQVAVKAISGLQELFQVSSTVAERAKDLGSSFKSTTADIDSYKSKIEELYETINDSNSSISEVTNARRNLMTIQDELIEKYGTEKEVIDTITDAVNGQADAFDRLIEKKWIEKRTASMMPDFGRASETGLMVMTATLTAWPLKWKTLGISCHSHIAISLVVSSMPCQSRWRSLDGRTSRRWADSSKVGA